ncbi:tyrosine recombinase XerC [Streptomyces sp. NPDC050161]|uniref:tyrosine recombinase XerC n=1 Tax=Streptomyces sp. NPDC050161 TaxID=3365604 RepID=UPI003796C5AF
MKGSTFRRCACRNPETGKQYGQSCPKLSNKRHGLWNIRQELPPHEDGTRRTFRRSGYPSKTEAQADLDKVRALLAIPGDDDPEGRTRIGDLLESVAAKKEAIPEYEETQRRFRSGQALNVRMTVGAWLDEWLAGKRRRDTTVSGYESRIRVHLKPRIGHVALDRLRVGHLVEMFDAIEDANEEIEAENQTRREQEQRCKWGKRSRPPATERARLAEERAKLAEMKPHRKLTGPTSRQRIRATLRAALNDAIAQQLITFNPAAHVELDSGRRPKALVWTRERIAEWKRTGEKPSPVMVWTPEQTGQFLDRAARHRLYALYHLIAFRGLRRGEACGQRWTDTDLNAGLLTVARQLVQHGWKVEESAPKTDSGARVIALDAETVKALKAHRRSQRKERLAWGEAYTDTGRVFTQENGEWLHPAWVTDQFQRLAAEAGLPPIRLHDLRHGAATLALAAGADMKVVQEMLGHSSITITSDTYTSVLPEVAREAAEAAARLVPRQAARTAGLTSGSHEGENRGGKSEASRPVKPGRDAKLQVSGGTAGTTDGGPSGARTLNQWIKSPGGGVMGGPARSSPVRFPLVSSDMA